MFGSLASIPKDTAGAPQIKLDKIATKLLMPVQVTHADDGSGRIFVVELKRAHTHHQERPRDTGAERHGNETPFLDISDRVSFAEERGLFNIVFPPTKSTSQHFYVSYTNKGGATVISRFTTSDDPDRADPDSEEIVPVDQPREIHNGGRTAFGPQDGYLYIGIGDSGVWWENSGQNTNTLLGKILRIDVESDVKPYGIPASNPFTQVVGYRTRSGRWVCRQPVGICL